MMNHPLNSIRYADLAGRLTSTLKLLNDYLEVAIEHKKLEIQNFKDKVQEEKERKERLQTILGRRTLNQEPDSEVKPSS